MGSSSGSKSIQDFNHMSKLAITRTDCPMPQADELNGLRKFLFECIKGANADDEKAWRRLWKRITSMEAGEISFIDCIIPRNSRFHRKFFAMLDVGFEAWEPDRKHKTYKGQPMAKNREQFRSDVLILAGFYEQTFNLKGEMAIRAKSISFAKMDDADFEQVYSAVADVLLEKVLVTYKGRAELDSVVERMVGFL